MSEERDPLDPDVKTIHYRTYAGVLLWEERMIFSRLYAVGDRIVENGKHYVVHRVAVADDVQHVNFRKDIRP